MIDRTEAMTVVDVNTGKFVGQGGNLEEQAAFIIQIQAMKIAGLVEQARGQPGDQLSVFFVKLIFASHLEG